MQDWEQNESIPPPDGSAIEPLKAEIINDSPAVPMEESVLAELEKIRRPRGNWGQAIAILVISLAAFVGLGMKDHPVAFTATLIGVLFFHELGHYVGMRIFGYRNVRMFFIPLFGAAVSGQKTTAKSYQEAIVTLLGPLPGLCLAPVLLISSILPGLKPEQRSLLAHASLFLSFFNGFNLLPFVPFDGGRLLSRLLFSRNRYLEAVFQFLAGMALIVLGITGSGMILCFCGGIVLLSISAIFHTNAVARQIRDLLGDQMPQVEEPLPLPVFRAILLAVQARLPRVKAARTLAGFVFRVWEKMHDQPPGAPATVVLLLVYLIAVGISVPWVVPFFLHAGKG